MSDTEKDNKEETIKETKPKKDKNPLDDDFFFNDNAKEESESEEAPPPDEENEEEEEIEQPVKKKKKKKKKKVVIEEDDDDDMMSDSDDGGKKKKNDVKNETERSIKIAVPKTAYGNNSIQTSEHSILGFIPYNFLTQLIDPLNLYFIFLIILQLLPSVSVTAGLPTLVIPFVVVFIIRGIKESVDNINLSREAGLVNNQKTDVMRKAKTLRVNWSNVYPGDIIVIKDGESIPADCLILYSSNTYQEAAYMDPKTLNGNEILIKRNIVKYPEKIDEDNAIDYCNYFVNSKVTYQKENMDYNSFTGTLELVDTTVPLGLDNILLRGAILKNTDFVYCVVLYTG